MRVLHCYKDMYPPVLGGIETHIYALAHGLKHQVDVEVLVSNRRFRTEREYADGIRVTRVADLGRVASAALTPTYPSWLAGADADILHFHFPNPTSEMSYLVARPPGKVVVTYHSDIVRQKGLLQLYKPFMKRFLQFADRIIVTSPNYLDTSPWLVAVREKCRVIPLGIDVEPFRQTGQVRADAAEIRRELGDRLLLFCGALRYYKGLRFLLEAMQDVDAKLLVIGAGPLLPEEKKRAVDLGVSEKVHFVGELDHAEIPPWIHACDVLVLPSIYRSEAFGLIQLEAHACGKPVVSTSLDSGVPFVNEHEKTGLIVPPRDPAALAGALNRLLDNPEERAEMGDYARRRCEAEFTRERMCERVYALYRDVLGIPGN